MTVTGRGKVGCAKARYVSFTPTVCLISIKTREDCGYVAEAVNKVGVVEEATGVPQLTRAQVSTVVIPLPSLPEQRRIGSLFSHLDSLITLHQRERDALRAAKAALLGLMFPGPGESEPALRFSGFTAPWEQRKLGETVDVCSGRDYKHLDEGSIPVYGTGGYMTSINEALSYEEDAIGIGRKGTIDKPYLLKAPFWTVDTLFYSVPTANTDINFALCTFLKIDWKAKDESTGLPSLSKEAINETLVSIPSEHEQRCIGSLFSRLDSLITLHQRERDALRAAKAALLGLMFPGSDPAPRDPAQPAG